jgi:hypothetical protein
MKILVGIDSNSGNYVFDTVAKTITITGLSNIGLEDIYLITDVTQNRILYNFADDTLKATITNNIITLIGADMTSLTNLDKLQILIEIPDTVPANVSALVGITNQLSSLITSVRPLTNVDTANRQIVNIGGSPVVNATCSGTVSANLNSGVAEIGKVTKTYADSILEGRTLNNLSIQRFTF